MIKEVLDQLRFAGPEVPDLNCAPGQPRRPLIWVAYGQLCLHSDGAMIRGLEGKHEPK